MSDQTDIAEPPKFDPEHRFMTLKKRMQVVDGQFFLVQIWQKVVTTFKIAYNPFGPPQQQTQPLQKDEM